MIHNNVILNNPVVDNGFYCAKVINIEQEPSNYIYPKLLITLKLHPCYKLPVTNLFYALIYPTEKSLHHYKNFFNTYLFKNYVDMGIVDQAIGQWGSVAISKSEFEELEFSTVRFVYQPIPVRIGIYLITKEESRG